MPVRVETADRARGGSLLGSSVIGGPGRPDTNRARNVTTTQPSNPFPYRRPRLRSIKRLHLSNTFYTILGDSEGCRSSSSSLMARAYHKTASNFNFMFRASSERRRSCVGRHFPGDNSRCEGHLMAHRHTHAHTERHCADTAGFPCGTDGCHRHRRAAESRPRGAALVLSSGSFP